MRRRLHIAITVLIAVSMLVLMASCRTTVGIKEPGVPVTELQPEPSPAPVTDPEPAPQPEPTPEPAPEPSPEPAPAPQPEPALQPETMPEHKPEPAESPARWSSGDIGPDGGLVFEWDGALMEVGEPVYEAGEYDDVKAGLEEPWRIPSLIELESIYAQLVETGLWSIDLTYFWSSDEMEDGSVGVMNFDTGFEGRFYRDMDFVSLIPVKDLL